MKEMRRQSAVLQDLKIRLHVHLEARLGMLSSSFQGRVHSSLIMTTSSIRVYLNFNHQNLLTNVYRILFIRSVRIRRFSPAFPFILAPASREPIQDIHFNYARFKSAYEEQIDPNS